MPGSSKKDKLSELLGGLGNVEDYTSTLLSDLILTNQIPAPTLHEAQRARFVAQRLEEFGLEGVTIDDLGNVCVEIRKGKVKTGAVLVSANLDSELMPEENVFVSIEHDSAIGMGVGRNALGVAALISVAEMLSKGDVPVERDVILAATVGQEGEGRSRGMQRVAARYAERTAFALCLQGVGLRRIGHRSNARLGFEIRVTALRDDEWDSPAERKAVGCLSDIMLELYNVPLPKRSDTNLSIVGVSAGARSSQKADAMLRGEITSSDDGVVDRLEPLLEQKVEKVASATHMDVELRHTGRFRHGGLAKSDALLRRAVEIHKLLGLEVVLGAHAGDGSVLSKAGVPSLTLGLTTGGFLDDGRECVDIPPIPLGLKQVLLLMMTARGRGARRLGKATSERAK